MDFETTQRIQPELAATERLLWAGRPAQGLVLRKADLFMIPFSLLWGGFAIFWEYSAWSTGAPLLFLLFGLPFVLMGLYLIVGRFFADAYIRGRTYYAVSDARILILTEAFSRSLKSMDLKTVTDVSLSQRGIDGGTIFFGPANPLVRRAGGAWPGSSQGATPSFELDIGARNAYEIIRAAQRDAS